MPAGLMGPQTPSSILITPQLFQGILPLIPNFQFGYQYSFGNNQVDTGRLSLDYLLPISLGSDSAVFGEARGEFTNFWKTVSSFWQQVDTNVVWTGPTTTTTTAADTASRNSFNDRIDLSFGGGFRTIRGDNTLIGVNGFYDATRLGKQWYGSGSVGFEMAALLAGNDAVDLNFNRLRQSFQQ